MTADRNIGGPNDASAATSQAHRVRASAAPVLEDVEVPYRPEQLELGVGDAPHPPRPGPIRSEIGCVRGLIVVGVSVPSILAPGPMIIVKAF